MCIDFDVACRTCKKTKHLGQRVHEEGEEEFSIGFGPHDIKGASEASEFICDHLGHDLRIYISEKVPPGFEDV